MAKSDPRLLPWEIEVLERMAPAYRLIAVDAIEILVRRGARWPRRAAWEALARVDLGATVQPVDSAALADAAERILAGDGERASEDPPARPIRQPMTSAAPERKGGTKKDTPAAKKKGER